MNPPEDSVQAIIDAAQRFESPSTAVKTRTWSAVQRRWAAGDHGPPVEFEPSSMTTASATKTGLAKGWLVLAGGVLAGAVALVVVSQGGEEPAPTTVAANETAAAVHTVTPEQPEPAVTPETPNPAEARGAEALPSEEPETETAAPPTKGARSPTRATVQPRRIPTKAPPEPEVTLDKEDEDSGLQGEVALFGAARRALADGKPKRALELLERHHREFPKGTFARERELSRVTALCELGRDTKARDVATRYLELHPSDALRRRFAGTCIGALD